MKQGVYKNGIRLIPTEEEEQTVLFSWAALMEGRLPGLKWMHHIPNGGKRNKAEAARFKAAGVRAGVSDVFLPCPRGVYHGLYIEMKAKDGRPTEEQEKFIADMRARGYRAEVCYGAEEAERVILAYMEEEPAVLLSASEAERIRELLDRAAENDAEIGGLLDQLGIAGPGAEACP